MFSYEIFLFGARNALAVGKKKMKLNLLTVQNTSRIYLAYQIRCIIRIYKIIFITVTT